MDYIRDLSNYSDIIQLFSRIISDYSSRSSSKLFIYS